MESIVWSPAPALQRHQSRYPNPGVGQHRIASHSVRAIIIRNAMTGLDALFKSFVWRLLCFEGFEGAKAWENGAPALQGSVDVTGKNRAKTQEGSRKGRPGRRWTIITASSPSPP